MFDFLYVMGYFSKMPKKDQKSPHFSEGEREIIVKGARTHNLKDITVRMPRNAMVAITGLSGSGKSSLAFDTIFAEGQRRYVESLSSYARQFLAQMPKPDVDDIIGLSPAISIDQKSRSNNPRSTVATITEIYDYLRVLYARIGRPYSPISGKEIRKMTNEEIRNFVTAKIIQFEKEQQGTKSVMGVKWDDSRVRIFAPVVRGRKGEYYQLLYDALGSGYTMAQIDGEMKKLRERITLNKTSKHDIDLLVDEFSIHEMHDTPDDFTMRLTEAVERSVTEAEGFVRVSFVRPDGTVIEDTLFSSRLVCPDDGFVFPEIEPRLFSFNSPYGACPTCHGLGTTSAWSGFEEEDLCPDCNGTRLRTEALHVFIGKGGSEGKGLSIIDFTELTIDQAHTFLFELSLGEKDMAIAEPLLNEITNRLKFLLDVGLAYLTLSRKAHTLSGGESQRIRLASQLGTKLVGALYVLDEPTIGLHQRDNDRLIKTLTKLRDIGNTIIVVEHDEDTLLASDYIIDIGPGAGRHGGEVLVSDYLQKLLDAPKAPPRSQTLAYLRGEKVIEVPEKRRISDKGILKVRGGAIHNIKKLNIDVPLGRFVCITGVSGSGKSSFMYDILYKNLLARYDREHRSAKVYNVDHFEGDKSVSRVVMVDQSVIGRTPRSNPATYTGAWEPIRELFAATNEARARGWKANRFSFNVKSERGGGRCEACEGRGSVAVEMHFLPTVYVTCDVCHGKRFDKETLAVKYRNKNVFEVLEMTVDEALEFFNDIPQVYDRLSTLDAVGLGYIKLGQQANTLSGGESQRVKISSELYRPLTQKTVYLLDEPTVGLHYEDVRKLIEVLNKLVDRGNSVITIEHNLDLIKCADYLIDFGPEGGSGGGTIIAKGTPEDVSHNGESYTGYYLKKLLKKKRL